MVYDRYRERLAMSYPQFTRYVRRYVTGTETRRRPGAADKEPRRLDRPAVAPLRRCAAAHARRPARFQLHRHQQQGRADLTMSTVHLTLQGKGGVGKSFIASLLVQHQTEKGRPVVCIDTDPVNATMAGYRAFAARRVELMEGSTLNSRKFDEMMDMLLTEEATLTTAPPVSFRSRTI